MRTTVDGTRLRLGDVAAIKDGLEERLSEWHYDGENTQGWEIHAQYSAVEVARRVNAYGGGTTPALARGTGDKNVVG